MQEAWIALLKGIDRFEGRSSLRTWLFTVLINIAKTRARGIAAIRKSKCWRSPAAPSTPPVFGPRTIGIRGTGDRTRSPRRFPIRPKGSVLGDQLVAVAQRELEKLPEKQRLVVTMRDMLDLDSAEVREVLDISVANERVLLHRGRAAVRQVLEDYVRESK